MVSRSGWKWMKHPVRVPSRLITRFRFIRVHRAPDDERPGPCGLVTVQLHQENLESHITNPLRRDHCQLPACPSDSEKGYSANHDALETDRQQRERVKALVWYPHRSNHFQLRGSRLRVSPNCDRAASQFLCLQVFRFIGSGGPITVVGIHKTRISEDPFRMVAARGT